MVAVDCCDDNAAANKRENCSLLKRQKNQRLHTNIRRMIQFTLNFVNVSLRNKKKQNKTKKKKKKLRSHRFDDEIPTAARYLQFLFVEIGDISRNALKLHQTVSLL